MILVTLSAHLSNWVLPDFTGYVLAETIFTSQLSLGFWTCLVMSWSHLCKDTTSRHIQTPKLNFYQQSLFEVYILKPIIFFTWLETKVSQSLTLSSSKLIICLLISSEYSPYFQILKWIFFIIMIFLLIFKLTRKWQTYFQQSEVTG